MRSTSWLLGDARGPSPRYAFLQADALVVSGDIAESNSLDEILRQMDAVLTMPVYFVLGNHDFYRGDVAGIRSAVAGMVSGAKNLVYLSQAGVVELLPSTALVGHDGWPDARLGDFDGSNVIFNDFLLIDELRHWNNPYTLDRPALRKALQALGDEAAGYLKGVLPLAAEQYPHVIVATHVPPIREAAWYQGRPSGDEYLPFVCCKAVGDVLLEVARSYPKCQLLVLSVRLGTIPAGTVLWVQDRPEHQGGRDRTVKKRKKPRARREDRRARGFGAGKGPSDR